MERRLNCYNYIFGTCLSGNKCCFGHVIVKNKEDYHRRYVLNEDGTRDLTSQSIIEDRGDRGDRGDKCLTVLNCANCNATKCEKRSLALFLRQSGEAYMCKECHQRNKGNHDGDALGFFDRLGVYNM